MWNVEMSISEGESASVDALVDDFKEENHPSVRVLQEDIRKAVEYQKQGKPTKQTCSKTSKPRARVPCRGCRLRHCSNCMVPFKNGDKLVTMIPTRERREILVPLDMALVCIFDDSNPYPKWQKAVEKMASLPSDLIALLGDEVDEVESAKPKAGRGEDERMEAKKSNEDAPINEEKTHLEKRLIRLFNEVETELKESGMNSVDAYLELVKTKINKLDSENPGAPTPRDVKRFLLQKLEDFRVKKQSETKQTKLAIQKVAQAIDTSDGIQGVLDFQFCIGCAELLIVLFNAWEDLQNKRLSEDLYYYAVIIGFKDAKHAQEMIFRAPVSSRNHILNKYAKEFHPIGCLQKCTKEGIRYAVGHKEEDLIKSAVGTLHSYLDGSYRRVYNEMLRLLDEIYDEVVGDQDEEDGIEEEEAQRMAGNPKP